MKKVIIFLLIFSACKKAENKDFALVEQEVGIIKKVDAYVKTDTIAFNGEIGNEYALAHLISKKWDKDSVCTAYFKIDFIKEKNLIFSKNLTVSGYYEISEWFSTPLFEIENCPLVNITLGYQACGYSQNNFVFHISDESQQLVNSNVSFADAPYSEGLDFFPIIKNNILISFYSIHRSIGAEDDNSYNEDDEKLIVSISDSTTYNFENKKWKDKLITQKGKIYRTEEMSF
ncbi:hypothetical protein [Flavobacterium algicola]|uniref:hypothetical protein n=1 Tax=Flavobacterium algicola TaxID=556529 RepID=UPI001EFE0218|nr:hypothetical protein [Flavobacterium algicola]MCG9792039.1 hypothetical protein [Flavobacterium algicola]